MSPVKTEADSDLFRQVTALIDRDEIVQLASELIDIASPTGSEGPVADILLKWFEANGFESLRQEVEPGRYNAVGVLRGARRGTSLSFNAHMDTALGAGQDDVGIIAASAPALQPRAFVQDGVLYGMGAVNDKGPMAAFLVAAKAISRAGIGLAGDLILAAVIGEIGRAPIEGYQGPAYRGKGIGTRYLVTHGVVSDYAINAEPSGLGITWCLPGAAFFRITTTGEPKYAPYAERSPRRELSQNAIVKMMPVIEALEQWGAEYEVRNRYNFSGGTIVPKVNLGAIRGGAPFKPNWTPGLCAIYVEVFTPPDVRALDVKRQIEAALDVTGVETRVDLYLSQNGQEGKGVEPLVQAVEEAYEYVFGTRPRPIASTSTSMWNDVNLYNEVGIPAVKFGPSAKPGSGVIGGDAGVAVEDLHAAAKVYAVAALTICGVSEKKG